MKRETGGGMSASYDLAFVGAGLSSAAALLALLDRLIAQPPQQAVHILVTDKDDQLFTGIAYGQRSSNTSLIITPLRDFLGEAELAPFRTWMAANLDDLLDEVRIEGGDLTEAWITRTSDDIRSESCNDHHVPRFFFGRYMADKIRAAVDAAAPLGITVTETVAEVGSLTSTADGYDIASSDDELIGHADGVVLGLGMPPTRSLFGELSLFAGLIDDPYQPSMASTRARIASVLADKDAGDDVHVLIIGANASGLEMLYQLTNAPGLRDFSTQFTMLSPQGRLPERYTHQEHPTYVATTLTSLAAGESTTAAAILQAAHDDIEAAKSKGHDLSDYLPAISSGVGALLPLLSDAEKLHFVNYEGVEIGRIQRRAGHEYSDTAQDLIDGGTLKIISGYYDSVTEHSDGGFTIKVTAPDRSATYLLDQTFDLVLNCAGSAGLRRPNPSPLLEQLMASGLCVPTDGGNGIVLDDTMAAAAGLYVIGPLMSGNVVDGIPIWHVEHAGRILSFSQILADHLEQTISTRQAATTI